MLGLKVFYKGKPRRQQYQSELYAGRPDPLERAGELAMLECIPAVNRACCTHAHRSLPTS